MCDESKIEEILICKMCLGEIKEEERCWVKETDYCLPCVEGDDTLKEEIKKSEKEMLEKLMEMLDEEGKKELLEQFGDYFNSFALPIAVQ
jgi:hypothetical protein